MTPTLHTQLTNVTKSPSQLKGSGKSLGHSTGQSVPKTRWQTTYLCETNRNTRQRSPSERAPKRSILCLEQRAWAALDKSVSQSTSRILSTSLAPLIGKARPINGKVKAICVHPRRLLSLRRILVEWVSTLLPRQASHVQSPLVAQRRISAQQPRRWHARKTRRARLGVWRLEALQRCLGFCPTSCIDIRSSVHSRIYRSHSDTMPTWRPLQHLICAYPWFRRKWACYRIRIEQPTEAFGLKQILVHFLTVCGARLVKCHTKDRHFELVPIKPLAQQLSRACV